MLQNRILANGIPDAIAPNKAYPSRRGPANKIVNYMAGDQI